MRCVSLVLLFIVATMASASGDNKPHFDVANARSIFEGFKSEHKRQYKDQDDEEAHFQAFVANLEKINKLNEQNPSATYGINKFADYTEEEMKSMRGFRKN